VSIPVGSVPRGCSLGFALVGTSVSIPERIAPVPPDMRKISDNKFKLGLFASNAWGGLTETLAPERWDANWDNNVRLAKEADAADIDFMLPSASWLGLGGDAATDTWSLETLTWAAGLLAVTEKITIFGAVHAAYFNPVVAAKQISTVDLIGHGRFGLNIVADSKPDEYELMESRRSTTTRAIS